MAAAARVQHAILPKGEVDTDRVYSYSDGIIEQGSGIDGKLYTTERLEKLLAESKGRSGAETVARTIDALADWAGKRSFTDDVSLVCFEWLGA